MAVANPRYRVSPRRIARPETVRRVPRRMPRLAPFESGRKLVPLPRPPLDAVRPITPAVRWVFRYHPVTRTALDLWELHQRMVPPAVQKNPGWLPAPNFDDFPRYGQWWELRHGPNDLVYYLPYYTPELRQTGSCWVVGETGPNTGFMSGQAHDNMPVGSPVSVYSNRVRYGYLSIDGARDAQYIAWTRNEDYHPEFSPDPTKKAQADLDRALGGNPKFLPTGAPDPFAVPERNPWEGLPADPLAPTDLPLRHNSPRVSEVVRLVTPDVLGEVSVQPGRNATPLPGSAPRTPQPPRLAPGNPIRVRPHRRDKPGPRRKEVKGKAAIVLETLQKAIGSASEIDDIMEAAWDALPKHRKHWSFYKGKPIKPNWKKMWADVYLGAPEMDVDAFVKNLVEANLQDEVIGRASGGASKAFKKATNAPWIGMDRMGGLSPAF